MQFNQFQPCRWTGGGGGTVTFPFSFPDPAKSPKIPPFAEANRNPAACAPLSNRIRKSSVRIRNSSPAGAWIGRWRRRSATAATRRGRRGRRRTTRTRGPRGTGRGGTTRRGPGTGSPTGGSSRSGSSAGATSPPSSAYVRPPPPIFSPFVSRAPWGFVVRFGCFWISELALVCSLQSRTVQSVRGKDLAAAGVAWWGNRSGVRTRLLLCTVSDLDSGFGVQIKGISRKPATRSSLGFCLPPPPPCDVRGTAAADGRMGLFARSAGMTSISSSSCSSGFHIFFL